MTLLCDAETDGSFLVHHFLSFYLKGMGPIEATEKETWGQTCLEKPVSGINGTSRASVFVWPGGCSLELITVSEAARASWRFLYIVSDIGPVFKVNCRGDGG